MFKILVAEDDAELQQLFCRVLTRSGYTAIGVPDVRPGTEMLDQLAQVTGVEAPRPLAELKHKPIRFNGCVTKEHMVDQVLEMLR